MKFGFHGTASCGPGAIADGRGLMVRLTDAGRDAIGAAAPQRVEGVRRYFFDVLSKQDLKTLAAVFDQLLENLAERASTTAANR